MINQLPVNMRTKITLRPAPVGLTGPCWHWTRAVNSKGYGCVGVNGKSQLTHRVTYTLLIGPIPDGLQIDHLCRNKRCCNPAHLEPVTGAVNVQRAARVERCAKDHPLAGPNLVIRHRGTGEQRTCRVCQMDWQHEGRARKSGATMRSDAVRRRAQILAEAEAALRSVVAA